MQSRCHNQTLAYVLIQMSPTSFVPLGSPLCTQILAAPDILRTYRSSWSALVLWAFIADAASARLSAVLLRLFVSCTIPRCVRLATGKSAGSKVPLPSWILDAGNCGIRSTLNCPVVIFDAGRFGIRAGSKTPDTTSLASCWCGAVGNHEGLSGMSFHDGSWSERLVLAMKYGLCTPWVVLDREW